MVASEPGSAWRSVAWRGGLGQPVGGGDDARVAAGQTLGLRAALQQHHPLGARRAAQGLREPFPAVGVLDQEHLHRRVLDHVGRVVGPVVGIERDGDQPQGEGGLVEHHPLGAVAQQQRHPVAGPQVLAREGGAPAVDRRRHLTPGEGLPALVAAVMAIGDALGGAAHTVIEEPIEGARALDGDQVLGPTTHWCLPVVLTRFGAGAVPDDQVVIYRAWAPPGTCVGLALGARDGPAAAGR